CLNTHQKSRGKFSHFVLHANSGTTFKTTTDIVKRVVDDNNLGYEWKAAILDQGSDFLSIRLQVVKGDNTANSSKTTKAASAGTGLTSAEIGITLTDPNLQQ